MRKKTRKIRVGDVCVGGDSQITVQSMTNTPTSDIEKTVEQIKAFEKAGCHISRSAINSLEDAQAIPAIKERTCLPFIADIQFDYKLALLAVEYGCDCLRINPGNIGSKDKLKLIVDACKEKSIPIRVGANSGSLSQEMIDKYGGVNVDSLVYSALEEVKKLEDLDFYDIKVSIKSSDVTTMIRANEKFSSLSDYPLHLGVTEAGPLLPAAIKSSVGIGSLLSQGIGDTIRVSITGDPVEEIKVGRKLLRSLGLLNEGINIVSCPSCSRTKIDLFSIVDEVSQRLEGSKKNLTVAIMGCPVNGPGEAKEADIGIAGSKGQGVIFKKGRVVKQVDEKDLVEELIKEINRME